MKAVIGSDNGVSPVSRHHLSQKPTLVSIPGCQSDPYKQISVKKFNLKMLSAKWRPSCPGLNVLICINKVRLWHNCTIRSLMKPTCIYHTAFLHLNRIISTMAANLWLPRACHNNTWWRHQMETFSALLAICAGNSPVTGEFPAQRPVTWSFDVFFDLRLNKRLSKQSWGWWFETPSRSLWRHCND